MSASPSASASCVSASASARVAGAAVSAASNTDAVVRRAGPNAHQGPPERAPPGGGAEHKLARDPSRRGDGAGEPQRAAPADRVRDAAGEERARRGAGEEQVVEVRRARMCDAGVPRAFKRAFERLGAQKRRRGRARVAQREPHAERRRGDGEDRQRGPERARPNLRVGGAVEAIAAARLRGVAVREGAARLMRSLEQDAVLGVVLLRYRVLARAVPRGKPRSPGGRLSTPRASRPVQQRRSLGAEAPDRGGAASARAASRAAETPGRGGTVRGPRGHPTRRHVTTEWSAWRSRPDCLSRQFLSASKFFRSDQRTDAF